MREKFNFKLGEPMSSVSTDEERSIIYTATLTPKGNEYVITWVGVDYDVRYFDWDAKDAIDSGNWIVTD